MLIKRRQTKIKVPAGSEVVRASIVASPESASSGPFVLGLQFVSLAELKLIRNLNQKERGYPLYCAQHQDTLEFAPPAGRDLELRITYSITAEL